jgi:hypothetical protein
LVACGSNDELWSQQSVQRNMAGATMGATVDNEFHNIFYYQIFVDTVRFLPRHKTINLKRLTRN